MQNSPEPEDPPLGVTQAQFGQWRSHPVTRVFLAYLRDSAAEIEKDAAAAWASGDNMEDWREMRGELRNMKTLADLRLEHIENFYEILKSNE